MATLILPADPAPKKSSFYLQFNSKVFASPLSQTVQTLEFPGAHWAGAISIPPMLRGKAASWQAFLVKLRGMSGRFEVGDADAKVPMGVASGSPLVKGASQTGNTLVTDGWGASVNGQLVPGDYFQVGTEYKMVTNRLDSDGSGNATITFEPPLRSSPVDNAPIITSNAVCVARLVDDGQALWSTDEMSVYGFSISFIESFT